jgi:hypothetical protein
MHDMDLERLDLKILRVSAIRAGQCHASGSSLRTTFREALAPPYATDTRAKTGGKKRAMHREYERALYEMPRGARNFSSRVVF